MGLIDRNANKVLQRPDRPLDPTALPAGGGVGQAVMSGMQQRQMNAPWADRHPVRDAPAAVQGAMPRMVRPPPAVTGAAAAALERGATSTVQKPVRPKVAAAPAPAPVAAPVVTPAPALQYPRLAPGVGIINQRM